MAIVLAVQRWRHYVLGRKFLIRTDQSSLQNLMEQTEIWPQYQRWVTKLLGYDFDIEYKSGKYNKVADALSRQGPLGELSNSSPPTIIDIEVIQRVVENDPKLQNINELVDDPLSHPKFSVHQGQLLYKGRLVLSPSSTLILTILHTYHDSVMGGHLGVLRICKRLTWQLV